MPRKPIVFISYSHLDEPENPSEGEVRWLSFVVGHLRPAEKHGAVEIWLDRLMEGGADWEREIERKLCACDVFILLVSNHAMASNYVVDREIAVIRERQANGEDVHFYPLLLTPTTKIALDQVRDKNLRPRDGQPFSKFSLYERHEKMCEAADEIVEIAGRIVVGSVTSEQQENLDTAIVDRPSLEAWFQRQSTEVVLIVATRAALRAVPVLALALGDWHNSTDMAGFTRLLAAAFRASAMARCVGKYPIRQNELRNAIRSAARDATVAYVAIPDGAAEAAAAADSFALLATSASGGSAPGYAAMASHAADASITAMDAGSNTVTSAKSWSEVRADIVSFQSHGAQSLIDLPLWSLEWPDWISTHWDVVRTALPDTGEWGVWTLWYQERLEGGSRGEAYELVFASVPEETWELGPAAANAWIKAHLSLVPEAPTSASEATPEIADQESLQAWLAGQSLDVSVAIAARAALRVAPFADRSPGER